MFGGRRRVPIDPILRTGAALAAGLGVGFLLSRRRRRLTPAVRELADLETGVLDLLLRDPVLSQRPVEVEVLSPGIVELAGTVRDMDEVHRAVELAQRADGVRTVLNRLDIEILATHLDETRRRSAAGAAEVRARRWYGMGIGTGRRRQSRETDPDRPDDRVPIVSRELGVDRGEESMAEEMDKLSPGVAGHTTGTAGPLDHGKADGASPRRPGNPPDAFRAQRIGPRVHRPAKKGTELTLDESGIRRRTPRRDESGQ